MSDPETTERLRALPAVDVVIDALENAAPPAVLAAAARAAIDEARASVRAGGREPSFDAILISARAALGRHDRSLLQPVLNATGVLIHTNLGRVPLADEQLEAVARVGRGYSNLEYDLIAGGRGTRYSHATALLTRLTGAESALVVNNNAAAVLLALAALCEGREVVISRGELIEIGGEFRIPDVMALSGARLVEVGTTNRTHLADYEHAIGPHTGAILRVHPSNYRVVGFTASVRARDLARLALGHKVFFFHDLGSGLIDAPPDAAWVEAEPTVGAALSEGADLVTFSGDKLLGGPQAGIILGRRPLIDKIARHPLLRAVRVDKMTLAALEATVTIYLEGRGGELPLWRMAATSSETLEERARGLVQELSDALPAGLKIDALPSAAVSGGGSLPGTEIGSWAVAIVDPERSAAELERRLRSGDPPVIARIEDDRLLLDLRTIDPDDDARLGAATIAALGA